MLHVPYRGGGPAITDLLGAQVQVYFGTSASVIEYVRSGRLRPLAVTSATRAAALPELPAIAEFLPGYEATTFVGIVAPRSTPADIVGRLNREINLALADPRIKQQIAEVADVPLAQTTVDFERLIVDETDKWAKVIRAPTSRRSDTATSPDAPKRSICERRSCRCPDRVHQRSIGSSVAMAASPQLPDITGERRPSRARTRLMRCSKHQLPL
jgi:hypothetical protein